MIDVTSIEVRKGETMLQVQVGRSPVGIVIRAKAHPLVEEFFKAQSEGQEASPVSAYARCWNKLKDYPDLFIYPEGVNKSERWQAIPGSEAKYFSLQFPGQNIELSTAGNTNLDVINLSWLRSVGISQGVGIGFSVRGVYSKERIDQIAKLIQAGMKRFYLSHLRPVNVTIQMIVQEASVV